MGFSDFLYEVTATQSLKIDLSDFWEKSGFKLFRPKGAKFATN